MNFLCCRCNEVLVLIVKMHLGILLWLKKRNRHFPLVAIPILEEYKFWSPPVYLACNS